MGTSSYFYAANKIQLTNVNEFTTAKSSHIQSKRITINSVNSSIGESSLLQADYSSSDRISLTATDTLKTATGAKISTDNAGQATISCKTLDAHKLSIFSALSIQWNALQLRVICLNNEK